MSSATASSHPASRDVGVWRGWCVSHPQYLTTDFAERGPGDGAARTAVLAQQGWKSDGLSGQNACGNAFYRHPPGTFRALSIGKSFRLFDNAWSRALLVQWYDALVSGGQLEIAVYDEAKARRNGYLSVARLQEFFEQEGEHCPRAGVWKIQRRQDVAAPVTIWHWYQQQYGMLHDIAEQLRAGVYAVERGSVRLAALLAPLRAPGHDLAFLELDEPMLRYDRQQAIQRETYFLSGASYKSKLVAHILDELIGVRGDLVLVDIGGGPALFAAEMLLSDRRIERAICVEPGRSNALVAHSVLAAFPQHLTGRLQFVPAMMEDCADLGQVDVVCFLGALLYAPRPNVDAILNAAWESLRPGGVLILHENVKAPQYTEDFDRMFTELELDSLLRRFGEVRSYLSTATVLIPTGTAAGRTVFRVVQKRGR